MNLILQSISSATALCLAVSIQVLNTVQGLCQRASELIKAVATHLSLPKTSATSFVSRSSASSAVWPSCVLPKGEVQFVTPSTRHQFFHLILHLMNKPLLSSGSAIRAFRAGAALFALLFVFGVGSSMAQTDRQLSSTLTGSQGAVKQTTLVSPSTIFVSNTDAMTILKAEVQTLQTAPTTGEAEAGAMSTYYMAILDGLRQGGNIADIFDSSANQLNLIVANYDLASRPDFATIRQNLFDLVTL